MAVASASYRFLMIDIGAQGRHSDGGTFRKSVMGQRFANKEMDLPVASPLHPNTACTLYVSSRCYVSTERIHFTPVSR